MRTSKTCLMACLLFFLTGSPLLIDHVTGSLRADEKTRELAVFLPENVNTVSILRLPNSLSAKRKFSGKWNRILREHFGTDKSGFLVWGDTLLVGSLFHPSIPDEAWATGVAQLPKNVSIKAIANEMETSLDTLSGRPVLKTPTGNYAIQFPANVLGIYRPGLRQDTANWITSAMTKKSITIKPYLQQTLDKQGDVVLSLNLEHLLDPQFVKSRIEQDQRFVNHQKLIDTIAPLISGLRGVTLTATVDEKTECEITIEFSSDVGPSAGVVKTLFLSVLEDIGAMIDEFPEAKISVSGKSVKLRSQLSEESLHRLLSLIVPPNIATHSHEQETRPTTSKESATDQKPKTVVHFSTKQRATKRYYESVGKMIANLQKANRNAKNYKNTIAWHENFARSIENLSPRNVERIFLVFGQRTAKRFRALASSLEGQEVRVNLQEKTLTYRTDYDPGWASVDWWGGAGYRPPTLKVESNLQEVRKRISNEELKGYEERQKIWKLILEDQQEMKNHLEGIR